MELSIIIVNYNTKKLTLQCIKSIYESKPRVKFEVIVVDNSGEMQNSHHYSLITNHNNMGFAKANNQGITKAKGKYILLLNSDTEVKKGAIDKLYEHATSDTSIGAVGAKLLNPDGSVQASVFKLPTLARTIRSYWLGEKNLTEKYIPSGDEPAEVEVLVMAAFMITPTALEKAGMLDERYFMYFEDLDYCRKLREKDLKIVYLPSAEVIHYHGASGKKLADDANQWRRLVRSSKIYHGTTMHYLIFLTGWTKRQWNRVFYILRLRNTIEE